MGCRETYSYFVVVTVAQVIHIMNGMPYFLKDVRYTIFVLVEEVIGSLQNQISKYYATQDRYSQGLSASCLPPHYPR